MSMVIQGQTAVRTDVVAPTITSDNLDSASCLNIASDADSTTGGLQFTPQLTVSSDTGEITTTTVLVDGTPFVAGPAELTSVPFDQLTLPDGLHTLSATVTDSCGNTSSAFGYETLDGVELPTAITFTVDTVAPVLTLTQPADGFTFDSASDVDPTTDGIQLAAQFAVDPTASLEDGQTIEILIDGTSAETIPADVLMGADPNAPQSFFLTTKLGVQAVNLRAVDACENPSVLPAPVNIENLETGCDVVLSGLPENNLFTSNDGTADANGLQTSISANIDTTLAGCVGATVTLTVDGTEVANEAVPADGVVTFPLSLVAGQCTN